MTGRDTTHAGAFSAPAPHTVWDPVVRLTHWTLAAAIIANGLLTDGGSTLHVWIGWIALGTLALRMLWGVIGPREARFTSFLPDPRGAVTHLLALVRGRPAEHASHNPAGALMAYALWVCLAVVVATGLVMTDGKTPVAIAEEKAAVAAGDWSALVSGEESGEHDEDSGEIAEEVHEAAANLMLLLAILHVAGVAVESRALGRNLVRGMVTGRGKTQ